MAKCVMFTATNEVVDKRRSQKNKQNIKTIT